MQEAGDYAKEGALAGPIAPQDAQSGARLHRQVYVLQGVKVPAVLFPAEAQGLLQPSTRARKDPVTLRHPPYGYGGAQVRAPKVWLTRVKSASPAKKRITATRQKEIS